MYDARELADARADYTEALLIPGLITRTRTGTVKIGGGTGPRTATTAIYAGRVIDAKRDRFHKEGEQMKATARLQIEVEWDADVRPTDILQVAGGGKYTAIGSDAARSERLCLTVDVTGA